MAPEDMAERRQWFEYKVSGLVSRKISEVRYWDIHNFTGEPRIWDHGDWHHAVMGVELRTDAGPFTITWTNTFYPYGVEVFAEPIEQHVVIRPEGPEGWDAHTSPGWTTLLDVPIVRTCTFWETVHLGRAIRQGDGVQVEPARSVDVPVAIRLDFDAGNVWFVAGQPGWPNVEDVFIPGDEIVVAFAVDKLLRMGFPDDGFARRQGPQPGRTGAGPS